MAIPKTHYIHSRNGRIGATVDTQVGDIDTIVAALRGANPRRLIIHFHGGLVTKQEGMEIAERLLPVYSPGGHPLFFVWESGLWETVRNNLADISREPIFQELVRKLLEYALGRLGVEVGTRSVVGPQVDPEAVKAEVRTWFAQPQIRPAPFSGGKPYADAAARAAAPVIDENQIQMDLEADADFVRALQGVAEVPAGVRSATGVSQVRHTPTKMDAAVLTDIAPRDPGDTRSVFTMVKVAILVAKVLARIVGRMLNSRDHGFYATVVEEVLREFYGESIGKAFFWKQMKKDTQDAFGGDPNLHAGTALLARLKAALAQGLRLERIFLVGHSTGGIYISHFLEAVDAMLFDAGVKFDIVLLAPANTHELLAKTIAQQGARIRWLRMFAMKDEVERDDGLLGDDWKRAFYPSSLLYLVSGLLEDEPDAPLGGMQRFLNMSNLFTSPRYAASDAVRASLAAPADREVWSITGAADADGLRSEARKHGDFDNDPQTLKSLTWIVTH